MSAQRIADRYAKMLVDSAEDSQTGLDTLLDDCKTFKESLENKDLLNLYNSPIINALKKKTITEKIFSGKVSDLFLKFLLLIIRKRREPFLPEISNAVLAKGDELKGITRIHITSTSALTDAMLEKIKDTVKGTGASRKKLLTTQTVDEGLIGGYKVEFDGMILDNTIKGKLQKLKRNFANKLN